MIHNHYDVSRELGTNGMYSMLEITVIGLTVHRFLGLFFSDHIQFCEVCNLPRFHVSSPLPNHHPYALTSTGVGLAPFPEQLEISFSPLPQTPTQDHCFLGCRVPLTPPLLPCFSRLKPWGLLGYWSCTFLSLDAEAWSDYSLSSSAVDESDAGLNVKETETGRGRRLKPRLWPSRLSVQVTLFISVETKGGFIGSDSWNIRAEF